MIERQGGDPRVVDDYGAAADGAVAGISCAPNASGFVTRMRAEALGRASNALGAGRTTGG